ncbi:MAG: glucose-1-phosphate adenylyltransferase, partial [Enterococcus sp.]|nr:glucose-1-phosphate adenylyltransferase [Enterococcus sp.]
MRANKMCAILGNVYECPELLPLTEKRPLAT